MTLYFFKTKTTDLFKDHHILNQDLKNVSLQKKIRPVKPVLPIYADIMPVTEKNLLITGFLFKFCFIQN